jgi:hypothetical protein
VQSVIFCTLHFLLFSNLANLIVSDALPSICFSHSYFGVDGFQLQSHFP